MNRVHLKKLQIENFRNHEATALATDHRHVVLFGENGAGKTNILEALSYLSPGRGLRRATLDQLPKASGNGSWSVFAKLEGPHGDVDIGTGVQTTGAGTENQRKVRIDGSQAKTTDELLEHVRVLWLTPAMDGLFTGSTGDRRRFLDRLVLAIDPAHGRRVSDFEKLMRSRNKLLSEDFPDPAWLDATESQMAGEAVAIAAARQETLSLLSKVIVESNDPSSPFPDSHLSISGSLENTVGEMAAGDLETEYAQRLGAQRSIDARAGRTLEGPHRSDLVVQHRPKMMPAGLCSTGEQKALLTGIILAHARLTSDMAGFSPILLLDEIAAHLDESRRAALYDILESLDCQTWMTGTDQSLFEALQSRAVYFWVEDGAARPV